MPLKDKLLSDMHNAMRKGDRTRVSVLRLLRSSIGYEEINKSRDLDDAGVIDIVTREIRQRRESIEMYRQGKRQDLVDKEEAELIILQEYLPAQLGSEELVNLAKQVIQEVGAGGPKDKGKVMGRLMPQVRGKADGAAVNQVVTKLLADLGV